MDYICDSPEIENSDISETENTVIKAKSKTVFNLIQLGLTIKQISQALDLEIQLILESLKQE